MLLITEHTEDVNLITEEVNGEKQYHIDGILCKPNKRIVTVVCIQIKH